MSAVAATPLREALEDRAFLGSVLVGDSWKAWRTLLIAAMGEALTDTERALFTRMTQREREPLQRVEELAVIAGRRGGKSRAISVLAAYLAGLCRHPNLVPGERGLLLVVARDQKQATIILDYCEANFRASPLLRQLLEARTNRELRLTNGIDVEVRASDFRSVRGPTYVGVIADEVAFWWNENSANPDDEILNAVRPGLATTGGPLFLISSPYARRGELWRVFQRNYGPHGDPRILVAHGTSRDFNPTLPQAVVDRAMERDPASASAEYLAQFRSDIEGFINRDAVEACVVRGVFERPSQSGTRYAGFVDPSGGVADAFTLAVAHRESDTLLLDCVREVRPPFSPESVAANFAGVCKSYRISKISGDRYAGLWPVEQFRKYGIRYEQAAKPKSDLYRDLLPLLNSRRVELLDHTRLINQLVSLERRTARSGRDSIDHGPGGHDDVANACAGALLSAFNVHKQRALIGSYGYGGGPITWRDAETGQEIDPATREPIQRQRIRVVNVPEALAPAAKGKT